MKTCTKCGKTKPLVEFSRSKGGKDGRHSWCKECWKGVPRHRPGANRRWENLWTFYRMTREDWEVRMIGQRGLCAEPDCGRVPSEVDHDHAHCAGRISCGECVRGLVCSRCNKVRRYADLKSDSR